MKFRKPLIYFMTVGFLVIFSNFALACIGDIECGIGNVCVKPQNAVSSEGICVTPTDQYGMTQNYTGSPSSEPHQILECNFDTDCSIGFSCMKRSGELTGICVK